MIYFYISSWNCLRHAWHTYCIVFRLRLNVFGNVFETCLELFETLLDFVCKRLETVLNTIRNVVKTENCVKMMRQVWHRVGNWLRRVWNLLETWWDKFETEVAIADMFARLPQVNQRNELPLIPIKCNAPFVTLLGKIHIFYIYIYVYIYI